jgi:hypothetical protein
MRPWPTSEEAGPEGPAPSVLPPASALGLLLSRALSSGRVTLRYTNDIRQTRTFRIVSKRKTSGVWGQSPQGNPTHRRRVCYSATYRLTFPLN